MSADETEVPKEPTETEAFNETFKLAYAEAIVNWSKTHPGKKPPVVLDEDGKMHWLNRKERRKQMALQLRKRKGAK